MSRALRIFLAVFLCTVVPSCRFLEQAKTAAGRLAASRPAAVKPAETPRLVLFIGVDISGSFMHGKYFDDSIDFLARYIYSHLHGLGGMEVPHSLFVGSIGGSTKDEAKTLYPIEAFQERSVEQIEEQLHTIFPRGKVNTFTDFNAFFSQVADMIDSKKLILKPISIVLLTDGHPDLIGAPAAAPTEAASTGDNAQPVSRFRSLAVTPLEGLSRNITVRVLYTDAVTAKSWRDEVPRKRVKIWTQDAVVMTEWKDPRTMLPGKPIDEQTRFFAWVRDNVDFQPRLKRVD